MPASIRPTLTNTKDNGAVRFFQLVLRKIITGYVLETYTFIDEQISDAICRIYFKKPLKRIHFARLWKTKKFRSFVHNGLDNLYPLHKMRLLHDIKPIPNEFRDTIQRINDVRNALAHSFFPENRRSYREDKKVVYRGIDLFTLAGLERFEEDRQALTDYLWFRANGRYPAHKAQSRGRMDRRVKPGNDDVN